MEKIFFVTKNLAQGAASSRPGSRSIDLLYRVRRGDMDKNKSTDVEHRCGGRF